MLKTDKARREEHLTIRHGVGFYDFTHDLVDVKGADAAKYLDTIFVNSIEKTKVGKGVYTTMLNEEGKIVDDVILFRLAEDQYWISTLYVDELLAVLNENKGDAQVEFKKITDQVSMFAVQGPKSPLVLEKIVETELGDQEFFSIKDNKIDGFDVKIARSDFTGEYGFEIYLHPDKTDRLRELLLEAGKEYDIKEMETDVILKSLPVEKGFVLMSDLEGLTPQEALFGWSVDYDTDFIGKKAIQEFEDTNMRLRGFRLLDPEEGEVDIQPEKSTVYYHSQEVGRVTSFTYGYTVEQYIGFILVDTSKVARNLPITIECCGKTYNAITQDRIFYDTDDTRRTNYLPDEVQNSK